MLRHENAVSVVAFSPDGRWLATASDDTTARLWRVSVEDLADLACDLVRRNLTESNWRLYLGDQDYRPTCPNLPAP